jgi:hypothetical protein
MRRTSLFGLLISLVLLFSGCVEPPLTREVQGKNEFGEYTDPVKRAKQKEKEGVPYPVYIYIPL